ncbi:unnamed protein product [Polarella glacialis]|uniref:Armadillo repeat-containing protein 1 n=1 Tax=Polarella glacialis TaxID=89957 RepID=A0A813GU32_POLGL|nr:unnamed protein product [Polarella glacialis]
MAAAAALGVVKQIQALADGPPTPEMRDCLGQVVSSLLFFLDHPDSRVRISAAKTLVKLNSDYPDDVKKLDVSRARSALAHAEEGGDQDSEELRNLLQRFLGEDVDNGATNGRPLGEVFSSGPRGEVVLKVSEQADGKVRAAMLEKIVALPGVVSVTFEGVYVIVSTRTPTVAADASFLADLLSALKALGAAGVSLVSAAAASSASSSAPRDRAASSSSGPEEVQLEADASFEEEEGQEAEPAYLDDEDNDVAGLGGSGGAPPPSGSREPGPGGCPPSPAGGPPQWTFFTQNNWMSGRRIQEFDDDPTIASRLAKAKKREEERKAEDKSKLGRLSSWLTGR